MSAVLIDEIVEKTASLTKEHRELFRKLLEEHKSELTDEHRYELLKSLEKLKNELINLIEESKVENKSNDGKNPSLNIEWLKAHRSEVAGKYVALEDGELLAEGGTLREVDQEAKRKGARKPLLTYVARADEELWAGW